jgi:osmotically inducible lipoprotein OsmB
MKKWLAIGFVAISVAACQSPQDRAVGGAAIGGLAGAAIGGAASGTGGGALAGAAIGAVGGAMVGAATAPANCQYYYYAGRRYQECY